MAGDHNWSGPRTPRPTEPLPVDDAEFMDPARGETVARCFTCGMPGTTVRLVAYRLVKGARVMGGYVLCGRCVFRAQERLRVA